MFSDIEALAIRERKKGRQLDRHLPSNTFLLHAPQCKRPEPPQMPSHFAIRRRRSSRKPWNGYRRPKVALPSFSHREFAARLLIHSARKSTFSHDMIEVGGYTFVPSVVIIQPNRRVVPISYRGPAMTRPGTGHSMWDPRLINRLTESHSLATLCLDNAVSKGSQYSREARATWRCLLVE